MAVSDENLSRSKIKRKEKYRENRVDEDYLPLLRFFFFNNLAHFDQNKKS